MKHKQVVVVVLLASLLLFCSGEKCLVSASEVIKIGIIGALTGPLAKQGTELKDGLADYLALANEEGGVHGKKLEYIVEDSQYNVETAKKHFASIMEQHKPLIIFGESTATGLAMADEIKNRFKVLYSSSSFSGKLAYTSQNPYVFVAGPTYGDQMGILLKYIAKQKRDAKVAFLCSDTEMGRDPVPYGQLMCRKLRLDLVATTYCGIRGENVDKAIQEIKSKTPDYIVLHGFVARPVPKIIQQCREVGINGQFAGTILEITDEKILEGLGPLSAGFLGVSPYVYWRMNEVPAVQKMRAFNQKHHPEVTFRNMEYLHGWLNGLIFVECLKRADRADQLNGDGLVNALQSLKEFDTGGLCAPLTFKNNRFPSARIWKANPEKRIFEPISEWTDPY